MAFLRVKRIRGRDYAYLVESRWDPERRASRQVTLGYLGPADRIHLEDVPPEHRTDRVRTFILKHSGAGTDHQAIAVARERFLESLVSGDREEADRAADEAERAFGLDTFYVEVLTPAMHRIGDLWRAGDLSVSMEHLASNLVRDLLDLRNATVRGGRRRRGTAVLCTPQGEMHSLAAKVLEGLLLQRGYTSWNIAASAPTETIADFIVSKKPDLILVSLTIPQYLPALKRLLGEMRARKVRARVLVGGQGVRGLSPKDLSPDVELVGDGVLAALDAARMTRQGPSGRGAGLKRPRGSGSPQSGSGSPRR